MHSVVWRPVHMEAHLLQHLIHAMPAGKLAYEGDLLSIDIRERNGNHMASRRTRCPTEFASLRLGLDSTQMSSAQTNMDKLWNYIYLYLSLQKILERCCSATYQESMRQVRWMMRWWWNLKNASNNTAIKVYQKYWFDFVGRKKMSNPNFHSNKMVKIGGHCLKTIHTFTIKQQLHKM